MDFSLLNLWWTLILLSLNIELLIFLFDDKKKKKKILVKIFCRLVLQYLNLNSAYIKHDLMGNNCEETLLVKILLYLLKKLKKKEKKGSE